MSQPNDNVPLADVRPHPAPEEPGSHPVNRGFDALLVVAFIAVLVVPFIGTWAHWDPYTANTENRVLAPFPETPHTFKQFSNYTDDFSKYFRDHFGFRNTLIHHLEDMRFRNGLLTDNNLVIIGKDGWLFLSARPHEGYLRERGFMTFTEPQLDQWQKFLEDRAAYFKKRGMPFIVTFAPDKQTIYPEFMPDGLQTPGRSRLDQLIERLQATHSPVHIVDLRPVLFAKKEHHHYLYFKTDTHWNAFGAYFAYRVLIQAVQKALPQFTITPQEMSNFTPQSTPNYSGDLVPMLGLDSQLTEPYPDLIRKVQYKDNPATQTAPHDPAKPTLVLFHDSFGNFLPDFIGPHFDRTYFNSIDTIEIEPLDRLKPDVVIMELVERKLDGHPPTDPEVISGVPPTKKH